MALQVLERLSDPSQMQYESLQFTYYLQYQLHRQLLAVSNYAAKHHVALKGDLPIGMQLSFAARMTYTDDMYEGLWYLPLNEVK